MTGVLQWCAVGLMVAGLLPAMVLASRDGPADRLVGLQLGNTVIVVLFLVLVQIGGHSYELVVPLVFVTVSFAGTLVFTRLLSANRRR